MILKPRKLEYGETIGVVAPASPMNPELLAKGIEYLEKCGYNLKVSSHVSDVYGYLAGSERDRADDIHEMFKDPEVRAIFCARGGYGTPRLLDLLQLAVFKKTLLVTFSGPMVAVEMGKGIDAFTAQHFWSMITASEPVQKFSGLNCIKPGVAEGKLLGGNLSMICSLIGSAYLPDFQNVILFLEDVGEEPYQIDRKLMQLKLAGILEKVSGVIFGKFAGCEPKSENPSLSIEQILHDVLFDLEVPVAGELRYGHVDVKYTLPLGVNGYLDAKEGYLQIKDSPVI